MPIRSPETQTQDSLTVPLSSEYAAALTAASSAANRAGLQLAFQCHSPIAVNCFERESSRETIEDDGCCFASGAWSPQEESILQEALFLFGDTGNGGKWDLNAIVRHVGSRSVVQVRNHVRSHYVSLDSGYIAPVASRNTGRWTKEERELLEEALTLYGNSGRGGHLSAQAIARHIGSRNVAQVDSHLKNWRRNGNEAQSAPKARANYAKIWSTQDTYALRVAVVLVLNRGKSAYEVLHELPKLSFTPTVAQTQSKVQALLGRTEDDPLFVLHRANITSAASKRARNLHRAEDFIEDAIELHTI
jgi:hypothetical protein